MICIKLIELWILNNSVLIVEMLENSVFHSLWFKSVSDNPCSKTRLTQPETRRLYAIREYTVAIMLNLVDCTELF